MTPAKLVENIQVMSAIRHLGSDEKYKSLSHALMLENEITFNDVDTVFSNYERDQSILHDKAKPAALRTSDAPTREKPSSERKTCMFHTSQWRGFPITEECDG